jgi:hypothetical protein
MLGHAGLVLQVVGLAAFKFGWSMASARRRSGDADVRYGSIVPGAQLRAQRSRGGDL